MNRNLFFAVSFFALFVGMLPYAVIADEQAAIDNLRKIGGTVRPVAANDQSKR